MLKIMISTYVDFKKVKKIDRSNKTKLHFSFCRTILGRGGLQKTHCIIFLKQILMESLNSIGDIEIGKI